MAQLSHISIISAISPIIIFLLVSPPISPCSALEFTFTTFINNAIFTGDIGPLSYSGTCVSGNYSRRSDYESNLSTVFSNLTTAAAASKTFSNATAGLGRTKVQASYYCLEDVMPNDCLSCVQNLTKILTQNCATKKAVMYSNMCNLWYTDGLNFPEDDTTSLLFCHDTGAKIPDPISLNQTVTAAMERLIKGVTYSSNSSYYSAGADEPYGDQKVYTAVKCAPGDVISGPECQDCLRRALNESLQCLGVGATWGADYRPDCRMRYDLQPFKGATSPASAPEAPAPGASSLNLSPTPANTNNSSGSRRSKSLMSIIFLIAAIVLLK